MNARIKVYPKGGITVTPSKVGEVLDMKVLLEDLDDAALGGGMRSIFVALKPAMPTADQRRRREHGPRGARGAVRHVLRPTQHDARRQHRPGRQAGGRSVVEPGETFSLNAAMGPRTTNRGFDYAPVIAADGVLRQGVGGGICQYATTLFNAVLLAGLPIVERQAHSLYISHYPIGRDATVAWGAIDFKFRNDTGKALLIRSWVQGGRLTVAIVGKTGREVTFKTGAFYDIRKPAHGKSDPRVIYDADLGPGVVRWERGIDGHRREGRAHGARRQGRGAVPRHVLSHYEPLDWVKRVGI